jgi:CBS domain-containing protein
MKMQLWVKDGMKVERLMKQSVVTCTPYDTLDHAASKLWEWDCGMLPVCESGEPKLKGVITDRDICMHAHLHNKPLTQIHVADAMSDRVKTCFRSDSLAEAEAIMRAARVRRLPVIDSNGDLVGILSLADLAREAARQDIPDEPNITLLEVGDTLSRICASQLPVLELS